MTFEAQLVPGSDRYRARSAEEHERAFTRAIRHSRNVAILRKVLPVAAVLVLATYFISTRLSVTVGGVTASVSGVEVSDGNLRMVNPTLKGVDKKNGAYVVSADYADQDMKNPKLIKLHAIKAELTTDQKGWSRMQAVRGLFNSESERLIMQDDIRVSTSSGVTGKLTHASLEMRRQTLRSHQTVAFDLPSGTVRANALTLNSADKTLLFRGKVRVHIVRVDNKQPAAGQAPRPPQIKAPDAPARMPPEQPVPVLTEIHPTMSMTSRRNLRAAALGAVAIALSGTAAMPAQAQTMTNTFGGFSKNSNQPIDIESDVLVVHDAQKYATFKGNVKAVQGSTTLRATELDVHYVGGGGDSLTKGPDITGSTPGADAKGEAAGSIGVGGEKGTQISKIEARGEVVITSDQDQTTTSDWALYDVPAQLVTVGGNVVLMQGQNVLKGDRLVIDLKTGESRFENKGSTTAGGRIRALFMPKDAKPGDDSSKDDKSSGEKSADKSDDKDAGKDKAAAPQPAESSAPAQEAPLPLVPSQRQ